MGGSQFPVYFLRTETITQGRGDQVLGQNIQGKGYRIAWFNVTGVDGAACRRNLDQLKGMGRYANHATGLQGSMPASAGTLH